MSNEPHATKQQLEEKLEWILEAPSDEGVLRMISIRPARNIRRCLTECEVSPEGGVHGDNWRTSCSMKLADGESDPKVQVAVMNSRLISLLDPEEFRQVLAGDQLYVDLNLGEDNLPVGQQLSIGSARFEVTPEPHTGCSKFSQRFGAEARAFLNSPEGKRQRLRGVYFRVVEAGSISTGDVVRKV